MKNIKLPLFILTLALFQGEASAKERCVAYKERRPACYVKPTPIATPAEMEQEVFHLINEERAANSLPLLTWSEAAAEEARGHSLNMANKSVPFSHEGSDARFKALTQLIPSLRSFGENVAYNKGYSDPSKTAVSGWIKSPGHYENIMGEFNLTGVGVKKNKQGEYYFTQLFVKTAPSRKRR